MAMSDKKIIEHMNLGNIKIDPFNKEQLASSSYDVTLGEWFFREQKSVDYMPIYDIYDKKHTEAVWGTKPFQAKTAKETLNGFKSKGIRPNDKVILIEPGETILAHTNEFIGGKNCVTTMMKARSSMGRNFIEICKCAGWGDVGYINRWTMEITNNSRHHSIPLLVGGRIAQIVFFETGDIMSKDYAKLSGKYQIDRADFEKIKKAWKPEMMLPRLYKDRE